MPPTVDDGTFEVVDDLDCSSLLASCSGFCLRSHCTDGSCLDDGWTVVVDEIIGVVRLERADELIGVFGLAEIKPFDWARAGVRPNSWALYRAYKSVTRSLLVGWDGWEIWCWRAGDSTLMYWICVMGEIQPTGSGKPWKQTNKMSYENRKLYEKRKMKFNSTSNQKENTARIKVYTLINANNILTTTQS